MLIAQIGSFSIIHLIIVAMVIAGCVGILIVVLRQAGVAIPPWVTTIFWIVLVVVVGVVAVKFLASLL